MIEKRVPHVGTGQRTSLTIMRASSAVQKVKLLSGVEGVGWQYMFINPSSQQIIFIVQKNYLNLYNLLCT